MDRMDLGSSGEYEEFSSKYIKSSGPRNSRGDSEQFKHTVPNRDASLLE
jgi:hypothetical protein